MYILGISAFYHDSAAALIQDEVIIAAAQEERFSRKKQDSAFPRQAIEYCLKAAGISLKEVDYISFYDKPFLKFERLLETYLSEAPRGFQSFVMAVPIWLKEKLFLKETLARLFNDMSMLSKNDIIDKLMFGEHHQSHAASAFYPSPFEEAAILTIDGVGEWATTSLAHGKQNHIEFIKEINFPHSIGLLYSAFTYYIGFKVNSGEYKLMGLAPYGKPKYVDLIKAHLIDIKADGSYRLDMRYFNYATGLTMTNAKFDRLFGAPVRKREGRLTQKMMDLAASVQAVIEEVVIKMARHARQVTGAKNLCLAGGVALNCVSNGRLLRENIFQNIWIQPAAGDAGGALGSAYAVYYEELSKPRHIAPDQTDKMQGTYLGPKATVQDIKTYLDSVNAVYHYQKNEGDLINIISDALKDEKVIGWHQGRMEFGPRALGNRSIIGDARSSQMQSIMNLKIKYRESFRPFAPAVLREKVNEWFDLTVDSPYMLLVAQIKKSKKMEVSAAQAALSGVEQLNVLRCQLPAITHVDYSARIQSVAQKTNPRYYRLISQFEKKTGVPVVINTSFNVRGEPIVCTPKDSYHCFMRTEMDILVIDDFILYKNEQPDFADKQKWQTVFELD